MHRALAIAMTFGLTAGGVAAAETKAIEPRLLTLFEARVYHDASGRTLRYRLFQPVASHPATNRPIVLFLHGAAGLGDDNARQFNGGNEVPPLALTSEEAQSRFPCFVLAPQCPRSDSWSGYGVRTTPTMRMTMELLERLPRELPIDRRRVYLVGVSMGGRGVWEAVKRWPDVFAAAVPICAAGDPRGLDKIKYLPIWCFHGAADTLIPVEEARRMMAALRQAGGSPRYTEYPGVGHDSYRNAFKETELLPWLFAQCRP